jgi:hypothetical protein
MSNYCSSCKNKIVLHAFSYGKCELCDTEVSTAHIPCDKICLECSEKYGKCESCGFKIEKDE